MPTNKSLPTLVLELKDLVVTYVKQETIGPIKNLGRFLVRGVGGSLLLGVGLVLLELALLRGLQTQMAETFDGRLSFLPYVITIAVSIVVLALSARAIGSAKRRRAARP
ncbi:MAG: hypothetical protein QOF60_1516 [Actinomycetota bacterium]|jgi:uncharacterized membrane protein YidH (DUF202 family)|nr:hypothetical protein [Actinomycetota bacterium]